MYQGTLDGVSCLYCAESPLEWTAELEEVGTVEVTPECGSCSYTYESVYLPHHEGKPAAEIADELVETYHL